MSDVDVRCGCKIEQICGLKSMCLMVGRSSRELKINLETLQDEKKRPRKKIKNHFEAARG